MAIMPRDTGVSSGTAVSKVRGSVEASTLDRDGDDRNSSLDCYIAWVRGRNKDSRVEASRIWNT
jgi:hypothetical protein